MALSTGEKRVLLFGLAVLGILFALKLLDFFPCCGSTSVEVTQSLFYWQSSAKPFAILESSFGADGKNVTLVLQNKDATGIFRLTGISLNGNWLMLDGDASLTEDFAPGDTKVLAFDGNAGLAGKTGNAYSFKITINYTNPNGVAGTQVGSMPLMGKYN